MCAVLPCWFLYTSDHPTRSQRGELGSTTSPRSLIINAIEWVTRGEADAKHRSCVLIGSQARKVGGRGDGIKRIQKIKSIPPAPSSL